MVDIVGNTVWGELTQEFPDGPQYRFETDSGYPIISRLHPATLLDPDTEPAILGLWWPDGISWGVTVQVLP